MRFHTCISSLLAALLLMIFVNLVSATPADIDAAVKNYSAGHPDRAIAILKPLAASGDSEAQYLLGNIIYGLAGSSNAARVEDAIAWYELAAAQDSAEANYALGVIYANRWMNSKDPRDSALAEAYYQRSADLGYEPALGPLMSIAAKNKSNRTANSLTYTDSSFGQREKSATKQKQKPQSAQPTEQAPVVPGDLGDPIAEANKLLQLIDQLQKLY
jgi:hypothetical protein